MRHKLIHASFAVDHDILWSVVTDDLPELAAALERALGETVPP